MARPVVNDLQVNTDLQPRANPIDNYQQAHAQHVNLFDFAALSSSLTNIAAGLEFGNAEKDQELGAAEFEKNLAEAMDGHNSIADAFAQAVSKGASHKDNPYFYTGFAKAAGREYAARFAAEGKALISTGYQESAKVNPETGIPPIADQGYHPVCIGKT